MKVLFDATGMALSGYHKGGAYVYGIELLKRLPQINSNLDLRLYFNFVRSKHKSKMFETKEKAKVQKHTLCQLPPQLLRKLKLPTEWFAGEHDVFHGPFDLMSHTKRAAKVVTIHDLAFLRAPEGLPVSWIKDRKKLVPTSAKLSDRIITVSEFSKNDIVNFFQIDPEKVQSIYHGISEGLTPSTNIISDKERLKERYKINNPFILYLGTLQPNKNIEGLCAAFQLLKKEGYPGNLVLAGAKGWLFDEMWQRIKKRNHDQDVILTGFIDQEDIPRLYSCCDVFTLVSFLEGFGIPVIEAMACGAAVVAADACSLTEVTADAGILVNPHNEEEIAAALIKIISCEKTKSDLQKKGIERAAEFTWERTANEHYQAYEIAYRDKL